MSKFIPLSMTNLQAALGVAQMEELSEFIKRKQKNYKLYKNEFADCKYVKLIPFREGISSNKWFYSLCIDRNAIRTSMRDIVLMLKEKGIETRSIWGLINEQKPYLDYETHKLEKAPYYADRILNIPSSTCITVDEIHYVAEEIKKPLEALANG